ncbi:MAG: response regulator transcription factor [Dehalococcoidia bacterium]|nr:MAG: response regulator transcription factor [Dehalococcoidia bacterium]
MKSVRAGRNDCHAYDVPPILVGGVLLVLVFPHGLSERRSDRRNVRTMETAEVGHVFREGAAMTAHGAVRVLLVLDRPLARLGLQVVLEADPEIAVVASVSTIEAAVSAARTEQPDVLIVDERLRPRSGIEVCSAVRNVCPSVRALLLVSSGGASTLQAVVLAGAVGYVLRDLDAAVTRRTVLTAGHSTPSRVDGVHLLPPCPSPR